MSQPFRPIGIVLQARDLALLQGLFASRLMTLKHVAALHFEGKIEAAKKRLQKLQAAGMVVQRPRRPQDPAIYLLGREGYLSLKRGGLIAPAHDSGWAKIYKRQRIGDLMLAHELAVMDVKVAFATAIAKRSDLELVEISTSPDRHKFRVVEAIPAKGGGVRFRSLYVKPDGFLHLRDRRDASPGRDRFFFLEVDRGTEALGRLVQKARQYGQFHRKGGFARRLGLARPGWKEARFEVLFAIQSVSRLANAQSCFRRVLPPSWKGTRAIALGDLLGDPLGTLQAQRPRANGGDKTAA